MLESLQLFIDGFELFRSAVYAALLAGFVLGAIGTYIAAQRIVFVSAALSQTSSLGVVCALFFHQYLHSHSVLLAPSLWAFLLSFLAILYLSRTKDRDALLGVIFIVGSAGTIIISSKIVEELGDATSLLFGSAVAVPDEKLSALAWVLGLIFVLHLWWFRGFLSVSLDPLGAKTRGLPDKLLQIVLMGSIALAIGETTRVLGAMPAFAFSVIPGLIGVSLSKTFKNAFVLAAIIGASGGGLGYILAYLFEYPVGATQSTFLALLYLISLFFSKRR